jgi:hypothetical protein
MTGREIRPPKLDFGWEGERVASDAGKSANNISTDDNMFALS